MQTILRWTVVVGLLWFLFTFGLTVLLAVPGISQEYPALVAVQPRLIEIGEQLGRLLRPYSN